MFIVCTMGIILVWIEIDTLSFKKIHLKMSFGKRRPFCLGLNMLTLPIGNKLKNFVTLERKSHVSFMENNASLWCSITRWWTFRISKIQITLWKPILSREKGQFWCSAWSMHMRNFSAANATNGDLIRHYENFPACIFFRCRTDMQRSMWA